MVGKHDGRGAAPRVLDGRDICRWRQADKELHVAGPHELVRTEQILAVDGARGRVRLRIGTRDDTRYPNSWVSRVVPRCIERHVRSSSTTLKFTVDVRTGPEKRSPTQLR